MTGRQVNIAIVGTGFIAETRARAYAGVTGYEPRIVAAVSRSQAHVEAHGIATGGGGEYQLPKRSVRRKELALGLSTAEGVPPGEGCGTRPCQLPAYTLRKATLMGTDALVVAVLGPGRLGETHRPEETPRRNFTRYGSRSPGRGEMIATGQIELPKSDGSLETYVPGRLAAP